MVYKLWMDGQVPSELLWAIMEKYPNISEEAMVHDDYTVFHFRGGRPDNVWLSELVPHVFVLQGNADASILYTNRDLTPEQAKKMRAFLNRVNGLKLGEQKRRLKP